VNAPEEVAGAAQLACLLEVSAPKPGNVSPARHFHDTRYEDFLASAVAIGPAMAAAGEQPLGATILAAVMATARRVRSNTNLGIILLLAPLAKAARRAGGPLRERVRQVLDETTVDDADRVYAAIRRARPGGLGAAAAEDVSAAPTVSLRDAMALAAERDSVAGEYATDFAITFEVGTPALRGARDAGLNWPDATVECYLRILAAAPDTHIARKLGRAEAERLARRARDVAEAGGVRTDAGRRELEAFDAELRGPTNARNPGTTADLTCAALFVVILEDSWNR
jgi:triphosphoribosyl-dephospho-CoA synthase